MGLVVDLLDTVAKLLGATPSPSTPPEDPTTPPTNPSTDPPPPPTSTPPPPTSTRTTTVAPPTSTTKPTTTAKPPSTSSSPAGTTPPPTAPASPSPGGGASGSSTTTRQVPHPIALPHDPNPGDDGDGTAPSDPNAPADPNAPSDPNGTQPTSDPAGSTLTLPGHSASQSWPTAGTWIPNTSLSSPGVEETGGAGGKGRILLSKGAIAAISITSFLLFLLALVCCVRCFFVRRRRNRAQSPSHWATTRPAVLFTRRHTESGMDFVTPRTSSERASSLASDEYARTNLFFSGAHGPPPSWSKASATQQRRMLKHPNGSESGESYGVPLPDDERLVTPVQQPEMSQLQAHVQFASVPPPPVSYRPQPNGWAYHPNTPLLSASTVSHSNSHSHSPDHSHSHSPDHSHSYGHGLDSPTSSLRGLPDHSNVDLEAVAFTSESTLPYDRAISPFNGPRSDTDTPTSYTTSPTIRATSPTTRTGAISPFITVIRHPDGHEELGADLDEPVSPRVKTPPPVALAPTGLGVGGGGMIVRAVTPVSPLFATSFAQADADPFASPLDGAVPVHGPIAR